jgi:hypothetical protein
VSILSVAAVPAAPRLFRETPDGAAVAQELRTLATEALRPTAGSQTRVLLAAGPAGVVHDRAVIARGAAAVAEPLELPVDTELLAAVSARGRFPRGRTDHLGGDLAQLARCSAEADDRLPVLPIEVPADASAETLEAVATGLRGAVQATGREVSVLAVGDLASGLQPSGSRAGGRGARLQGASGWDDRAVEALRAGDRAALADLGPEAAREVTAQGWAPLVVLLAVAEMEDLAVHEVRYSSADGTGRVVLRS